MFTVRLLGDGEDATLILHFPVTVILRVHLHNVGVYPLPNGHLLLVLWTFRCIYYANNIRGLGFIRVFAGIIGEPLLIFDYGLRHTLSILKCHIFRHMVEVELANTEWRLTVGWEYSLLPWVLLVHIHR